ncbi:hypothetical protein NRIC_14890 [Enterococcus florum]|uniref:Uncharacterized protein n=1 Tax=Enterococcus florum TaxID=2480627 RepID=A0A4P5PCB3_9ENTE|nr:hypothetical protein [Enterococcus florum]GCF93598.1 hypothetical protein NRIC_14890 [Enterococcus florum]
MTMMQIARKACCKIIYQRIAPTSKENVARRMMASDIPDFIILEYANLTDEQYSALELKNHELILEVKEEIKSVMFDNRIWNNDDDFFNYDKAIADSFGFSEEEIFAICSEIKLLE